ALYAESANERQELSLSNDTIYLTGGSYVKLPALGGGTGNDSLVNALSHKLDSLINVSCIATVNYATVSACDEYTWVVNGEKYTGTGVYKHVLEKGNKKGCDSIEMLNLTINHSSHYADEQTVTGFITWHGTAYATSGTYTYAYNNSFGCASVDTLKLKIQTVGGLNGEFTIASGKKVRFSRGNLQYRASTNTWRFAERQYDYVGNATATLGTVYVGSTKSSNTNISNTYDGWIDLFGWGTSNHPNSSDAYSTKFRPWDYGNATVNDSYNTYGFGPSTNMQDLNLVGGSATYDWGVSNAISNGGNQVGLWRTLTQAQWNYLFNTRAASTVNGVANARYCHATVDGVCGMILFPDNYIHPASGLNLSSCINKNCAFGEKNILAGGWQDMEAAGAVFLPAAGYRTTTTTTTNPNAYGRYWTSTYYSVSNAYYLYFYTSYLSTSVTIARYSGISVRLVQDIN
ncbi:MAG: hypothetical protein IJ764_01500, partial [Bacteroidales bacterium]|nr:hypothetical protein [Bacteroidales bacterium]